MICDAAYRNFYFYSVTQNVAPVIYGLEGLPITCQCKGYSVMAATSAWLTKDGSDTKLSKTIVGKYTELTADTMFNLVLPAVSADDIGNFTCWVQFSNSIVSSTTTTFLKLLYIEVQPATVFAGQKGNTATVSCTISYPSYGGYSMQTPTTEWFKYNKNGDEISYDSLDEGDTSTLLTNPDELATGLNKTLLPTLVVLESESEYIYAMKLTYKEYPDNPLTSTLTKLIILDINMTSANANTVPGTDVPIVCAAYDSALVKSFQWYVGNNKYSGEAKIGAAYNTELSRSEIELEFLGVVEDDAGDYYCSAVFNSFSLAMSAKDSSGIQRTTFAVMNIRTQPEAVTFVTPGYISFITCVALWPKSVDTVPIITWHSSTEIIYQTENVTNEAVSLNDQRYMSSVFQTPLPTPAVGTTYKMNITYLNIHGPGALFSDESAIKQRTAQINAISLNSRKNSYRTYVAFLGSELRITCSAQSNQVISKKDIR